MRNTIQLAEAAAYNTCPSITEAVDPKLFGDLRSLLAKPLDPNQVKGQEGDTYLTLVWRQLVKLYGKPGVDPDEIDQEVLPYVESTLKRMDERYLGLSLLQVSKILGVKNSMASHLFPDDGEKEFHVNNHKAIIGTYDALSIKDKKVLTKVLKLKLGNLPTPNELGFRIELDKSIFNSAGDLSKLLNWVAKYRTDLHLELEFSLDFIVKQENMVEAFKDLLRINPRGLKTVFEMPFPKLAYEDFIDDLGEDIAAKGDVTLLWAGKLDPAYKEKLKWLDKRVKAKILTSYGDVSIKNAGPKIAFVF